MPRRTQTRVVGRVTVETNDAIRELKLAISSPNRDGDVVLSNLCARALLEVVSASKLGSASFDPAAPVLRVRKPKVDVAGDKPVHKVVTAKVKTEKPAENDVAQTNAARVKATLDQPLGAVVVADPLA